MIVSFSAGNFPLSCFYYLHLSSGYHHRLLADIFLRYDCALPLRPVFLIACQNAYYPCSIVDPDLPPWLSSPDGIVELCNAHARENCKQNVWCPGFAFATAEGSSRAWIKYEYQLAMTEALPSTRLGPS